jgi:hypothetical protein
MLPNWAPTAVLKFAEFADQRSERAQFTGCHQLGFLSRRCPRRRRSLRAMVARVKPTAGVPRFFRDPRSNASA